EALWCGGRFWSCPRRRRWTCSLLPVLLFRQVSANQVQHAGRGLDIVVGHSDEGGSAHLAGGSLNLIDDRQSARGDRDDLGPTVTVSLAALDQSCRFERIEQAHDGGSIKDQRGGG